MRCELRGFLGLGLMVGLAMGCGGAKKGAASPADGDCEPGRCMVDISQRIDDRRPESRACYEAGYARDPSLQGMVVINFEIDPDGTVVDASQSTREDQIMDAEVVECIANVLREIRFAKSGRGKLTRGFHRYEFAPPAP